MGYVTDNLMPGERVIFETKVHWIVYIPPVLFFLISLLMWFGSTDLQDVGTLLFVGSVILGISAWVRRWTSEFAVTDRRLIAKVGLIRRTTMEMSLTKIESLQIDQDIGGRILGYGTVKCRGTGSGDQTFKDIDEAMAVRRHVYEQAELLSAGQRGAA